MINPKDLPSSATFQWLDIVNLDQTDIAKLTDTYNLTKTMIGYLTDSNERPHYDYDAPLNSDLFVYDMPIWSQDESGETHFTAESVKFLVIDNTLLSFHSDKVNYMFDTLPTTTNTQNLPTFLLNIFLSSTQYFHQAIKELDGVRIKLDARINRDITKDELIDVATVQKSIVYLASSIDNNNLLWQSLQNNQHFIAGQKPLLAIVDDILIESNQSIQMITTSQKIIETLSATANSIMDSNLNDSMKFLTVWSIILTVPAIMTGFFGMNVGLPFGHSNFDWVTVIIITLIIMMALVAYMKKKKII
ncbi:magnesium transporter CorA family protein [Convivina intestini]|uniref:Mg2+ and Co2+ transporter CorA n=1 Tax=Convivina intestini TaxID=1505726 RepID=A0A2U1D592_9LACO|nr:magnesium transporter CorA family protein [Convivina intestini]PVY82851.1 Mg2+ and Co2+ transporter CorA [Convivina intestini]CAH1856903.1 hypothetical protein R077811_01367 [Convivina intestini]SDC11464.1 Mg2+ and Co2+ transporter CorA [Leuconostocaceae bacterium R-53105]